MPTLYELQPGRILQTVIGVALLVLVGCSARVTPAPAAADQSGAAPSAPPPAIVQTGLSGTTWQLVEIAAMDDRVFMPAAGARYELTFEAGGVLLVQADCNRGRGTWAETGSGGIVFGPIATTRMACPPGSLDARFLSSLSYVRSYVLRDGHLYLATMADGAILHLRPLSTVS
ncbi:MAG: META domain-containing protein [Pseudomonadales bacterium]